MITPIVLLVLIVWLSIVQIPLDIKRRVLSRWTTISTAVAVFVVIVVDSARSPNRLAAAVGISLLTFGIYVALHSTSPASLGRGDVLLVVPLSMVLGYISPNSVVLWQLTAAISGTIHALLYLRNRGSRNIPFGPHLLVTTLVFIVFEVCS